MSLSSSIFLHVIIAKLLIVLLIQISLTITPLATGLSFNFSSFDVDDPITYEGSATITDRSIQLTRQSTSSIGRATYNQSLYLWNKSSGNLTDFQTHFSFVIDSQGDSDYGDGLTFFLAPEGSKPPSNMVRGSTLGLTSDWQETNTTANHFVAVEFDIFDNAFDPQDYKEHVGIDVNSLQSVVNISWMTWIERGRVIDVWTVYDSRTHNLSLVFTGFRNGAQELQYLSHILDLRKYLPERVIFGFTGATGNDTALHSVLSWDFSSTLGENVVVSTKRKSKTGLAVGLGVGVGLVGVICILGLIIVYLKKSREDEEVAHILDDEFESGIGAKRFPYHELARATDNFKDENKLGQGGFGGVYKGFLRSTDSHVAVKRVSKGSNQGVKEYAAEVKIISRLRHRNLVQLLGWCHERKEMLLVYEFLPNRSLDSHLYKEHNLLIWEDRYKIAQGLASGLLYLHEEWEQCVVHRDIKCSNVMLDSNFNAKLGDFGLARLVDHGKGSQTTVLAGTMGYMAPECATTGKASRESDVYSFGIVALELACGRKPIDTSVEEDEVHLVNWVWSLYGKGKLLEAADSRLRGQFDRQQIERLMIVGLSSTHPDENLRPSIRQSIHVLNFEAALPILPPTMPVPTYFTTPANGFYNPTGSLEGGRYPSSSNGHPSDSSQFTKSAKQFIFGWDSLLELD
ncbi:L-type lectin-domain containing receptor kinase IX.1-like [Euphorbia lathyris]|uniref:L-type lectin-domain containing receptor kinase IX.1-like n=1 Tax=Euphorbia lathyris TaxID=212925 RepID=UPI00331384FB